MNNKRFNISSLNPTSFIWLVPLAFLGIFFFYPLERIISLSFSRSDTGVIAPFIDALKTPSVINVLWFTIWQATLSTILTLIVGIPGAYLFARYKFRGKSLLRAITGVPFLMPTLVVAAGFIALLGPRGLVNLLLMNLFDLPDAPIHFTNTFSAILVAHIFYNTTIVLRMVGDFWSHLDPKLTQASQILGADRWQTLRYITIPLLRPAIFAAALLIFIFDFTSFGVVLVLGGPHYATLEVEIFYQTISLFNLPRAAVLSVLQLACTFIFTIIYSRQAARLTKPLSLRPHYQNERQLHTWRDRLMAIAILTPIILLLIAPLFSLAIQSFLSTDSGFQSQGQVSRGVTLQFYQELLVNRKEALFYVPPTTAIGISFGYAGITVILALLLGLPASWVLIRNRDSFFNRIFDAIIMLPLGTSAVTLGLGFIVALAKPPLDLRSSPLLVPIAHTLVAFPFVVRSLTPALRSIQPRLRMAAAVLGASPRQIFRFIDLPLVGRAMFVSATFAFTISIGEFGATSLISRPEYPTLPLVIYRHLSRPGALNYGQALALSTILMVVTTIGMIAIEHLRIADVGEF